MANDARLIKAYSDWLATKPDPAADAAFVAYMGESVTQTTSPTWVTIRTLHSVLGSAQAETLIDTLEAAASAIDADAEATQEQQALVLVIRRALKWMDTPGQVSGIDVGEANTRANLDAIAAAIPEVDTDKIDAIKALADRQITRSQSLGLGVVGKPQMDRLRLDGRIS